MLQPALVERLNLELQELLLLLAQLGNPGGLVPFGDARLVRRGRRRSRDRLGLHNGQELDYGKELALYVPGQRTR